MNTTPASPRGARRSNVALVVAVLALLASTTGTAYAAVVARNSVVSSSIKDGQVKYADLAAGSVTGSRIKDSTVTGADIADGRVTGADIADGRVGTADIKDGTITAADLSAIFEVASISPAVQDADGTTNGGQHGIVEVTTSCPFGTRVIGGGAHWTDASNANNYDRNVYLQSSHRQGNGWRARGIVDFGAAGSIKLRAEAYCLSDGTYTLLKK